MAPLTSTIEADLILEEARVNFGTEEVPINKAHGKRLAENIFAERDLPPFDRVAMDGIAICYDPSNKAHSWKIQGIQKAGEKKQILKGADFAIEIMTGAVLPDGANCIIPYERISIKKLFANLVEKIPLCEFQNVHRERSDSQKGNIILKAGARIGSPEIGVIVSQGLSEVKIERSPKIVIISTGDELIPPGEPILDHQVRMSNPFVIQEELRSWGFSNTSRFHLRDNKEEIHSMLKEQILENDLIILSGGVSKGKYDFVPSVLSDLNVECLIHGVSQRPGKPLWFGKNENNKIVFGLPGNPVSSLVCLRRYVVPFLKKCQGIDKKAKVVTLAHDFNFEKKLTYFAPVKVNDGVAEIQQGNGSGDFVSLSLSDGFVELEKSRNTFAKGESVNLFAWGGL